MRAFWVLVVSLGLGFHVDAAPVSAPFDAQLSAPPDPMAYYADLQRAKTLLEGEKFAEAQALYESLTERYALERESWVGLGGASRQLGQHPKAIAAYARAIELIGPVPGSSRYWTAVSQAAGDDKDAALATLETMVFAEAELDRPGLSGDPAFEKLSGDARMRRIAGNEDLSKLDRVEGWRADLAHLCAEIIRLSPDHRQRPLPEAVERIRAELHEQIPELTDAQVYAGMARLVGALGQGHTMFWGSGPGDPDPTIRMQFTWLPVLLYAFSEGIFVVATAPGQEALLGMQVLAINGVEIAEVVRRVRSATSVGSPMEALWTVPMRIGDVQLLTGLGILGDAAKVELKLRDPRGKLLSRALEPSPQNPRTKLPAPRGVDVPTFLRKVSESHWDELWDARKTVYVQLNQIAPDPEESLPQFGIRLRQVLKDSAARNLVIDLRHNNGGNTFTYVELLRTVVAFSVQPEHQVYVLIGRNVYSAAANFTTELERLANPILVGEPTSMTGNQHGDEGAIRLPWSGLRATVSGVRWQLSHPWDKRRSIAPKVPVQLTAEDYFAGRDPVLTTVQKMIDGAK